MTDPVAPAVVGPKPEVIKSKSVMQADIDKVIALYHGAVARAEAAEATVASMFKTHEVVVASAVAFLAGVAVGVFV